MALLKKKQKEAVPAELEAFYEREPAAKRWARRILAIIIVVVLVAGLAWAATKVYQQVTNRDVEMGSNGGDTAQQDTQGATDTADDGATTTPSEDSATTGQEGTVGEETTEQPAAPSTDDQTTDEGVVDSGAVSTTSNENLPSTGPADALWIVFGAITVGALGYQIKLRRQQ